jgi:hypothetical protein
MQDNIKIFHKFVNERLRDDLQKRFFALDTEIQERLQSMKIEIPNSIINALEVTPVVEISTAKKGWRVFGIWGDQSKGEGYNIGPFFPDTQYEQCSAFMVSLYSRFGLPFDLCDLINFYLQNPTADSPIPMAEDEPEPEQDIDQGLTLLANHMIDLDTKRIKRILKKTDTKNIS